MCILCDVFTQGIPPEEVQLTDETLDAIEKLASAFGPDHPVTQSVMRQFMGAWGPWECTDEQRTRVRRLMVSLRMMDKETFDGEEAAMKDVQRMQKASQN